MKILVLGGSGVIGYKIIKHLIENKNDVEYTYFQNRITLHKRHYLDITKKEKTVELIQKVNPDVVIHTIAVTNVDLCEVNTSFADSININGTNHVIEGCKITNSKLVYVSTPFVFDGKRKQYSENDPTSPSTYYGVTKNEGEKIVKSSGLKYLILRTDQPYCWIEAWQHTNSVIRVLQTLRSGNILKEITDWYNRPTYVPNFVTATNELLKMKESGIFHVVGSDFINRYECSKKTAGIFGLDKNLIKPSTSDTLNLPAKRVNVNLNNEKLFEKTGIKMLGIEKGLTAMLKTKNSSC